MKQIFLRLFLEFELNMFFFNILVMNWAIEIWSLYLAYNIKRDSLQWRLLFVSLF
jgi:hypothetical protein